MQADVAAVAAATRCRLYYATESVDISRRSRVCACVTVLAVRAVETGRQEKRLYIAVELYIVLLPLYFPGSALVPNCNNSRNYSNNRFDVIAASPKTHSL